VNVAIFLTPILLQRLDIHIMNEWNESRMIRITAHNFEHVPAIFVPIGCPARVSYRVTVETPIGHQAPIGMAGKYPRLGFPFPLFGVAVFFIGFDKVAQATVFMENAQVVFPFVD
jgi:hypothetical protein